MSEEEYLIALAKTLRELIRGTGGPLEDQTELYLKTVIDIFPKFLNRLMSLGPASHQNHGQKYIPHYNHQGYDWDKPFELLTFTYYDVLSLIITIFTHHHTFKHYNHQGDDWGEPFELGGEQQH